MSVLRPWEKDFHLWFTIDGFYRLLRLSKRLFDDETAEGRVIDQALALYKRAVEWEANPVFRKDRQGDYQPCHLGDFLRGPHGLYPYQRNYFSSWREWGAIQRLLKRSGDASLSVMIDRALELLEITMDGKLPQLYTFDNDFRYEPFELPLEKSFV